MKYGEETIVKKKKKNQNKQTKKKVYPRRRHAACKYSLDMLADELIVSIQAVVGGCKLALKLAFSIDSEQTYSIILFLERTPGLF